MKLLIFKTDIKTKEKVKILRSLFFKDSNITNWSIDREDIDNVLRIETNNNLNEKDVINLIKPTGFYCEELTD